MTDTAPGSPAVLGIRLVELTPAALAALADRDLASAGALAGVALTDFFQTDDAMWLWRYRLRQLAEDPDSARWIARAVVAEPAGVVVGYAVDERYRRRGYARAMLTALLRRAAEEPDVRVVRATISPDNVGSLATIKGFGFEHKGEQWDERDGVELIFEVAASG
jgi:RimJ/RimL family protein N-acetyltransferase